MTRNRVLSEVQADKQKHLQMKYDHAVAAAQQSTSGRTDAAKGNDEEAVEEDANGSDVANKSSRPTDSTSTAGEAQRAADLVEAMQRAHRKLQQLQASCCCRPRL